MYNKNSEHFSVIVFHIVYHGLRMRKLLAKCIPRRLKADQETVGLVTSKELCCRFQVDVYSTINQRPQSNPDSESTLLRYDEKILCSKIALNKSRLSPLRQARFFGQGKTITPA